MGTNGFNNHTQRGLYHIIGGLSRGEKRRISHGGTKAQRRRRGWLLVVGGLGVAS
jgi:hypothetical protein